MYVQQFFIRGLAHSSYLLGGAGTCAIIDPRRDVHCYIDAAKEMGMKITHILETHLHADFISGHLDLAEKTGAGIVAPRAGRCRFKHVAVGEGDTFDLEDISIRVLETPGHTPEHVSYVVTDKARGRDPVAVFCGDTLFVGDVGRPDLFPGRAKELASKLYDSLHRKLLKLPDACEVLPAHGAGSLCGRAMGAKRTSTIGYERKYNAALQVKDRAEFVKSLTTNMPAAPDHFSRCSAINGAGPALVRKLPEPVPVSSAEFDRRRKGRNALVLDIRPYEAFGGMHVPGAWHVDFGGNFATFAGWVLPPGATVLLVARDGAQAAEAAVWLRRVGQDRVVAYLEDGMYAWAKASLAIGTVPQVSVQELHARMRGQGSFTLLDVRQGREFEAGHIEGAVNIPMPDLRTEHGRVDKAAPVVVMCNTGHRSSLAASILKRNGFADVSNVAGGMTAYSEAGLAPQCPICVGPHGPTFLGR
jgi:hydroxyacylglutathione hydrolase